MTRATVQLVAVGRMSFGGSRGVILFVDAPPISQFERALRSLSSLQIRRGILLTGIASNWRDSSASGSLAISMNYAVSERGAASTQVHKQARGPAMTDQDKKHRSHLPMPNTERPRFVAYDAKDPDSKFPPIDQLRPPQGRAECAGGADRRRRLWIEQRIRRPLPHPER